MNSEMHRILRNVFLWSAARQKMPEHFLAIHVDPEASMCPHCGQSRKMLQEIEDQEQFSGPVEVQCSRCGAKMAVMAVDVSISGGPKRYCIASGRILNQ